MSYEISVDRGSWGSEYTITPPMSDEHAQLLTTYDPSFLREDMRAGYKLEPEYYEHELPDLHRRILNDVRAVQRILGEAGVTVRVVENQRYERALIEQARVHNASVTRQALGIE